MFSNQMGGAVPIFRLAECSHDAKINPLFLNTSTEISTDSIGQFTLRNRYNN